ncbi:hypothetical protein SDJN02_07554, partial [Cucurbita argyrosperma subsp. argyrosperma]
GKGVPFRFNKNKNKNNAYDDTWADLPSTAPHSLSNLLPPSSSSAATAARFSLVIPTANSVITVAKPAFLLSTAPFPSLVTVFSLSPFHFPIDLIMVFNFGVSESYTTDLLLKFGELCGTSISVSFRCQLPKEDLDALVSITSDEDLANLIEEYDRAASSSSSFKIRAFLFPPKYAKRISPPSSMASFSSSLSSMSAAHRCFRRMSPPHASYLERSASAVPCSVYNIQGSSSRMNLGTSEILPRGWPRRLKLRAQMMNCCGWGISLEWRRRDAGEFNKNLHKQRRQIFRKQ